MSELPIEGFGRNRRAGRALRDLLEACVAFEAEELPREDLVERVRRWIRRGGSPARPLGEPKALAHVQMDVEARARVIKIGAADAIRARREALGLTQEELSELAGVRREYLSRLERAAPGASGLERLDAVRRALGVSWAEVLGDDAGRVGDGGGRADLGVWLEDSLLVQGRPDRRSREDADGGGADDGRAAGGDPRRGERPDAGVPRRSRRPSARRRR